MKFLTNFPAVFIKEIESLVISDLHIGLEHELFSKGVTIPAQSDKFSKILKKLISLTESKNLIIVGDVKYKVAGISKREIKEIPKFLSSISEYSKVIITKGNHDAGLEEIVPKNVEVYSSRGFKIKKFGFFHGHAWPSKSLMRCDYLFMGHLQPSIELKDKFGYFFREQVWLVGKLNQKMIKGKYKINKTGNLKIIVIPSFNRLSGSLAVNKLSKKDLIGPFFKEKILDLDKMKVYLLDGTYLGRVKDLKNIDY